MKPKPSSIRGKYGKGKTLKREVSSPELALNMTGHQFPEGAKPSVEIVHCISYQKFRYSGENRPGKKYQEKEFMTLKLSHLEDKVVRVVIICTDAENRELIHPNGLVGKDCENGIYDKEYPVNKKFFIIKVPYLRTERIKTKKNEHEKIQNVLTKRAMHLPSPYKERCLSQCSEKYTESRRFDTTRVCFGVIVTVISHQGLYNGSLHAISHVVRNASEKTSLNILKLSQISIPPEGCEIDIFTTEDGPAIEPDKYEVYVSYQGEGSKSYWESEKTKPSKSDILYKRVIRYIVPQFEPNPGITGPVCARLHLDCRQSNQYCVYDFHYELHQELVIFEQPSMKRSYSLLTGDIKPTAKRLRLESEEENSSTIIKATLNAKLKARQEFQSNGDYNPNGHEPWQETMYEPQQVLVQHQDPHTGEPAILLDMDDSSRVKARQSVASINTDNLGKSIKRKDSYQTHTPVQDVEVVATGYSDAVPPNTTVYIYASNGLAEEQTASGASKEIEQNQETVIYVDSSSDTKHHDRDPPQSALMEISQKDSHSLREIPASVQESNASAAKTTEERITASEKPIYSTAPITQNQIQPKTSYNGHDMYSPQASTSSSKADHFSASNVFITASPRTPSEPISSLRRILIPFKSTSDVSPWEVEEADEDASSAYNILVSGIMPYASYNQQQNNTTVKEVKIEPLYPDDDAENGRSYTSQVQSSGKFMRIPSKSILSSGGKQLVVVGEGGNEIELNGDVHVMDSDQSEDPLGKKNSSDHLGETVNLGSMGSFFTKFIVNNSESISDNLPTMQAINFVDTFDKLPSVSIDNEKNHMDNKGTSGSEQKSKAKSS